MFKIKCSFVLVLTLFFCSTLAMAEDSLQEFFEKGQNAFQKGSYPEAIKYFEQAVEIDPNFAPVYNALGLAHQELNDPLDEVIWFFKVATDIDPNYADGYHNMCRAYYKAGKHADAERYCLKALSLNPAMGNAQLTLAWVYLVGKQQPDDAIFYFREVLKKVDSPMVYFGLGMAYSMNEDHAQVLDVITTLRSKGEDALATKLEAYIRKPILPKEIPDMGEEPVVAKPGQLVPAEEPTPKAKRLPTQTGSSITAPVMRIRLKGTLTNSTQASKPTTSQKKTPAHPGSLSPE